MASHVVCDKCGAQNRLGTLFCHACGVRMDLSRARVSRGGDRSTSARLLHLTLFLVIFAILGLLCWPASPRGDAPSANGAKLTMDKFRALSNAMARGNEVGEEIAEADLNGHLNQRLIPAEIKEGLHLNLREVRIDVRPGGSEVWLSNKLGPLTITYTARATVRRGENGQHTFSASGAKIGHVPMFGPLETRALAEVTRTFSRLREELNLINRIPTVNVRDGAVEISTIKN